MTRAHVHTFAYITNTDGINNKNRINDNNCFSNNLKENIYIYLYIKRGEAERKKQRPTITKIIKFTEIITTVIIIIILDQRDK